jgi:septum formation protein
MQEQKKIILCSASPRRQQLLGGIGFNFEVRTDDIDESFPDILTDKGIALYLAEKKANHFLKTSAANEILITADTIVWLDEKVLNKPSSSVEAAKMLSELSGRTHMVFTAVCIVDSKRKKLFYVRSDVMFRELGLDEINYYVENFNPLDKAGAYGAQECLPVGMNPCSKQEILFLSKIGKTELIEQSMNRPQKVRTVAMIEKIEGSYFNVMGFPVVEFYEHIQYFLKSN